jgi:hypothetical protein
MSTSFLGITWALTGSFPGYSPQYNITIKGYDRSNSGLAPIKQHIARVIQSTYSKPLRLEMTCPHIHIGLLSVDRCLPPGLLLCVQLPFIPGLLSFRSAEPYMLGTPNLDLGSTSFLDRDHSCSSIELLLIIFQP